MNIINIFIDSLKVNGSTLSGEGIPPFSFSPPFSFEVRSYKRKEFAPEEHLARISSSKEANWKSQKLFPCVN